MGGRTATRKGTLAVAMKAEKPKKAPKKAGMEGYVLNPSTGRMIKVGGKIWQQVFGGPKKPRRGRRVAFDEEIPGALIEEILSHKTATIEELKDTLMRTTQPHLKKLLEEQIKKKDDGRGSRTRGWRARAPQRGKPRKLLQQQCGDAAFLMPQELKFPIMGKCGTGTTGTCSCKIDCQGVLAAYVRARQYGYTNVAKAAKMLLESKCKASAAAIKKTEQ
jgi:hypothetical protein